MVRRGVGFGLWLKARRTTREMPSRELHTVKLGFQRRTWWSERGRVFARVGGLLVYMGRPAVMKVTCAKRTTPELPLTSPLSWTVRHTPSLTLGSLRHDHSVQGLYVEHVKYVLLAPLQAWIQENRRAGR